MIEITKSAQRGKTWRKNNPERAKEISKKYRSTHVAEMALMKRKSELKLRYGITLEDFERMVLAQGNLCAICNEPPENKDSTKLHIDHCHTTGKVRGLLCRSCNIAIGYLNDDINLLQNAIKYLEK